MSLTEMRKEYQTLQQKINALNEEMKEKSKILMKQEFAEFFEKYDGIVHSLFWNQYTPYFNDGESCEFSVHDVWMTLQSDADDEDYEDDGEGSTVYGNDDIADLKKRIAAWESFNADPAAAAKAYQSDYIKRYNRDPFAADTYRSYYGNTQTPEQKMAAWKPDYVSLESLRRQLADAENIVTNYPDLKKDYHAVAAMVSGIDENLMEAMFGDHVKVTVTKDGIETEDYEHD